MALLPNSFLELGSDLYLLFLSVNCQDRKSWSRLELMFHSPGLHDIFSILSMNLLSSPDIILLIYGFIVLPNLEKEKQTAPKKKETDRQGRNKTYPSSTEFLILEDHRVVQKIQKLSSHFNKINKPLTISRHSFGIMNRTFSFSFLAFLDYFGFQSR